MTKSPSSVEFRAVTKRYGTVTAVDAVSFTIAPGTLVTLLGLAAILWPNRCCWGKGAIVHRLMLGGLLRRSHGIL